MVCEGDLREADSPAVLVGRRLAVRRRNAQLVANVAVRTAHGEGDEGSGDVIGGVLVVFDGDLVAGRQLTDADKLTLALDHQLDVVLQEAHPHLALVCRI